jgi:hypothetical protein
MFKWLSWAIRTVITAVLLSFLCIWTTGYIVNSYMETLLKQMDLPLQTQPFALSGIWGKMWGAQPAPKTEATPIASPTATKDAVSQPTPNASASTSIPDNTDEQAIPGSPSPSEDTAAVPVLGGQSGNLDMSEQQKLSLQTVMSKLNAEQLAQLSASLKDGLTKEELTKLGEVIKPSLTESEYKQMMELLQTHTAAETTPSEQP